MVPRPVAERLWQKNMGGKYDTVFFKLLQQVLKTGVLMLHYLLGDFFYKKDAHYTKLEKNRNTDLTKLYTTDEITDVYTRCGMAIGPVRVNQLHIFYENYLAAEKTILLCSPKHKMTLLYMIHD
jgi:hypothetical protein